MTIKVSEESGGPYTHEIDAIRDERHRANVMNIDPDFDTVFADVEISPGAFQVIADINKPVEAPVGEFVENVVFHDEEVTPESASEEEAPSGDKAAEESPAPENAPAESGNAPVNADTPVETPVIVQELAQTIAPVADATPIFSEVSASDAPA